MKRRVLVAALAAACGREADRPASAFLVVETTSNIALSGATVDDPAGVKSLTVTGSRLVVELALPGDSGVTVRAPGACPLKVPPGELGPGGTVRRRLVPWLDLGPPQRDIGFDAPFVVEARAGCPEAQGGRIAWRQTAGTPLGDARTDRDGYRFSARTETLEGALGTPPPWGIVPLSPRTQGGAELEGVWSRPGYANVTVTASVTAAARSRGLPNVALGTRLHLGGPGWTLRSRPEGAHAALEPNAGATALRPDARGTWVLEDGGGRSLRLVAGKYDETPLDCGRGGCHGAISEIARSSPMTTVLQRGLDGPFAGDYPRCATGCHAVGEPGSDDGGFDAVLAALGRTPGDLVQTGWHELPPALRRLGGVGCLACHGPGAIPEESSRYAVLRADVCATCHDAPPRYGHVAAWRTSRMSHSDADPRVREGDCARCHTTWGFLGRTDRKPPEHVGPVGITCAACHAVHPATSDAPAVGRCEEALRRHTPLPEMLAAVATPASSKSSVCWSCHAPEPADPSPRASAAAIWAGRGGFEPATGAPLEGAAGTADSCLSCHHGGPDGLGGGATHGFRATRAGRASEPRIRERALSAWRRLVPADAPRKTATDPIHASPLRLDRTVPLGRAAWNLALVLEDPAADVHNAEYSRRLVESAERALDAKGGGP